MQLKQYEELMHRRHPYIVVEQTYIKYRLINIIKR
jgi:hypothetical protein